MRHNDQYVDEPQPFGRDAYFQRWEARKTVHARHGYVVQDAETHEVIPVLPTPKLVAEGSVNSVLAYEEAPASDKYDAAWRMKDDSYDKPDQKYRRVRVYRW